MVRKRKTVDGVDEVRVSKSFASPYEESTEELDIDDVSTTTFEYKTLDITYRSRTKRKTVRAISATGKTSYNDIPEGHVSFFADGGQKFAYNPDERVLKRLNTRKQDHTVATGDDIISIESVSYPESAVVEGAVSEDCVAKVYYRSPRSDEMQMIDVEVNWLENGASEFNGEEVGTGRRIEVMTRWERDIKSKKGTSEMFLGKVCRVEFPRGQRFSVDIEGLSDEYIERKIEKIERGIGKEFSRKEVSIEVANEGTLEWD